MRIITGSAKGAKLKAPRGLDTRPTTDRVKESVFNILGDIVDDAAVLDLFAGTGALGLEALSRGAKQAVLVDQSSVCAEIIQTNAAHTKLVERVQIVRGDVLQALDKLKAAGRLFDVVFCDPPYNEGYVERVLAKMTQNKLLAAQAVVIIEHSQHEPVAALWPGLALKRSERYGETWVSFFVATE